jgi:hypothetical protein
VLLFVFVPTQVLSFDLGLYPEGFPPPDHDAVALIGIVSGFQTPVYGFHASKPDKALSLVAIDAERVIFGDLADGEEFVSFGAIYTFKGDWAFRSGTAYRIHYLKPGQRVVVIASRRPEVEARKLGYYFGGRRALDFVRLLHQGPDEKDQEVLSIIHDRPLRPENSVRVNKSGAVDPSQFNLGSLPDGRTLGEIEDLILQHFGAKEDEN